MLIFGYKRKPKQSKKKKTKRQIYYEYLMSFFFVVFVVAGSHFFLKSTKGNEMQLTIRFLKIYIYAFEEIFVS